MLPGGTRLTRKGSSPLARGLLRSPARASPCSGIIPARAGFTLGRGTRTTRTADHPRSRGVYASRRSRSRPASGSSPLARGLRGVSPPDQVAAGIIPARAGFTSRTMRNSSTWSDHPRSRGVYARRAAFKTSPVGSSPLARGLRLSPPAKPAGPWDHPRSSGVYCSRRRPPARLGGSSPLARGLHGLAIGSDGWARIIPARAGFTRTRRRRRPPVGDHPRSRGVYWGHPVARSSVTGSSPLARGLPERARRPGRHLRIIPARAGFTPACLALPPPRRDHPRSRGVYRRRQRRRPHPHGSSPLARGLPHGG